ncbi:MAG: sigma-70 family RNA polymerase sigma factor [Aeromicrobium erythreum]
MDELDDRRLVTLARDGSSAAFATLYVRHRPVAERVAARFSRPAEVDDVVAEAFGQLLRQLDGGRGPDDDVRAYLLTSVRHEAGRRARRNARSVPTDDDALFERLGLRSDEPVLDDERELVRRAMLSLPDRSRDVLWALDVEGYKPREVAEWIGARPNTVSALAYRARAALRTAYLQEHVGALDDLPAACAAARSDVVAYVRVELTLPARRRVEAHVQDCAPCRDVLDSLRDVADRLPGTRPLPTRTATLARGAVSPDPLVVRRGA